MKQHYERRVPKWEYNRWTSEVEFTCCGEGRYSFKYGYYREIKTFNERRQNCATIADEYTVRGRRKKLPSSWDDITLGRNWKRSWKDFTKQRRQYNE